MDGRRHLADLRIDWKTRVLECILKIESVGFWNEFQWRKLRTSQHANAELTKIDTCQQQVCGNVRQVWVLKWILLYYVHCEIEI